MTQWQGISKQHNDDDDEVMLQMSVDILGTSCDQRRSMVQ